MKTRLLAIILSSAFASWAGGVTKPFDLAQSPAPPVEAASVYLTQGQIEILVAPIALYPDALVALILPASTRPSDIVLASRFLRSSGLEEDIDAQAWADSVKALARYPEVIQFLDENLAWTQEIGDAFVAQPVEVMSAVQMLRGRAIRNGVLASTTQQEVVFDDEAIRIVPAEPTVIYVPRYDPEILYYERSYAYYPRSVVWFGIGYGIGSWLNYDCDWGRRTVWVNHHHDHWGRGNDWRKRYTPGWTSHIGGTDWRRWDPSPSHRRHHPRSGDDFARIDTRSHNPEINDDRARTEPRPDHSSSNPPDSRTLRRPETFPAPPVADRNETVDSRANRGDRRSSEPQMRLSGPDRLETRTPSREVEPSQSEVVTAPRVTQAPPVAASPPQVRQAPAVAAPRPSPVQSRPVQVAAAPQERSESSPPPSRSAGRSHRGEQQEEP